MNVNTQNCGGNQQNQMNIMNCNTQNGDSTINSNHLHQQSSTMKNIMNCNVPNNSNISNNTIHKCKYCGYTSNRLSNVK